LISSVAIPTLLWSTRGNKVDQFAAPICFLGMVHQCQKTRLQILGNCSACAGRVVPEARIETKQAAQVEQNQLQKPLASLRQAQYKGFDTPPQKAWRLLNHRSLHWLE